MSLHAETRAHHQKHAEKHVKRAGYKSGGAIDIERDKKAIAQHEEHLHKGEPKTKLRLRRGGSVHGEEAKERLDKRARGGAMKSKHKPNVAVIIHTGAGEQEKQQAAQQGLRMGAALGARQAAAAMQKPPMAPPGGGGLPIAPQGMPGAGGPPRPPMMNRGGKLDYPNKKAGSGGAAGRLEKNNAYPGGEHVKVRGYVRRRAGGAIS